jgi:WD40 repeat protein
MVAVLDEAAVRLLRLEDGEALSVHPIIGRTSQDVAWDPGQRYIAFVDSANILRFWSPGRTGGVERRFELRSPVGGIAISPDGTRVAVGNGNVISFFGVNDPGGDIIH